MKEKRAFYLASYHNQHLFTESSIGQVIYDGYHLQCMKGDFSPENDAVMESISQDLFDDDDPYRVCGQFYGDSDQHIRNLEELTSKMFLDATMASGDNSVFDEVPDAFYLVVEYADKLIEWQKSEPYTVTHIRMIMHYLFRYITEVSRAYVEHSEDFGDLFRLVEKYRD